MYSYTRTKKSPASNRLSHTYTVRQVDLEVRAKRDRYTTAVVESANDTITATELTLDDFGGRSDALGG